MNLKPLDWTFDCGVWSATIMGLQLAVVQDADGTYSITLFLGGYCWLVWTTFCRFDFKLS